MLLSNEQVARVMAPRTRVEVTWPLTTKRPLAHRIPFIVCYSRFHIEPPFWSWNFTPAMIANLDRFRGGMPNRVQTRGNWLTKRAIVHETGWRPK